MDIRLSLCTWDIDSHLFWNSWSIHVIGSMLSIKTLGFQELGLCFLLELPWLINLCAVVQLLWDFYGLFETKSVSFIINLCGIFSLLGLVTPILMWTESEFIYGYRSSGGVVVKLLACGTWCQGFEPRTGRYDFRDWLSPASKSRCGLTIFKAT